MTAGDTRTSAERNKRRRDRVVAILVLSAPMALANAACGGVPDDGRIPSCGYFVAVTGSDHNEGTSVTTPFGTLEMAQAALRRGRSKVVCLRAGVYRPRSPLVLSSADNGETWRYYTPDGVGSAILDGGGNLDSIIAIDPGASNIRINGLTLQNFGAAGIHVEPRGATSNAITIENNNVGHGGNPGVTSAAIIVENTTNAVVANNYVHDMLTGGISMYAYNAGETLNGSVVENNVVLNTVEGISDSGAIYTEMLSTARSSLTIKNNYISDYGHSGGYGAIGIYLDEGANHVTVTGNVIAPPTERSVPFRNDGGAAFTNAGYDNTFSGNIVDLGDSGRVFASLNYGYVAYGERGNVYTGNIIISRFAGSSQQTNMNGLTGYAYFQNLAPSSNYTIENNVYWNYASGGSVFTQGVLAGDRNPIVVDPQISGWTYTIASNSPVYRPPVNFTPILGGWGPAGFVIPRTRTEPSNPH